MDNKTFTFLVTSNRKGQTKSITVTAAWLKACGLFLGIVLVLLGAASVDYFGLLLEANENKRLRAENITLNKQVDFIESKVDSLENSIEQVKYWTTKLKLITKVEDENRTMKLSLGNFPKPGQHIHGEELDPTQRKPASEFLIKAEKDAIFLKEPPLDRAKGELARLENKDYSSLSIRIDRAVKESGLREQSMITLYEKLFDRKSLLASTPNIKPLHGWYASRFGYRLDPFTGRPTMHYGLDIAAAPGTPIYSPADGVVSYVGFENGYGHLLTIDHGFGVKTRYAHNSRIHVQVGQKIKRRQRIASVGNTGRSSGPHLHYEVRVHNVPVDPINYILND